MSIIQSLVRLLPKGLGKDIEAQSRSWILRCPCGHETSVWDAGGVRYMAAGRPSRLARCPKCGLTWHTLQKMPTTPS